MMLTELTSVSSGALPVGAFREHLRLGTGFADDGAEDPLLESLLRAAIAAVEGRTGKVLLTRSFLWTLTAWRDGDSQPLPVAPVSALNAVAVVDREENSEVVSADLYFLTQDTHRPHLTSAGSCLPAIALGGRAEITFDAGFGAAWDAVPEDLAQAVFLLAGHYYEHRSEASAGASAMPFGVSTLLERWRTVRILGGAAT